MVPVWVTLVVAGVGVFGTLAGAALTQILTNRREAARDQLKWEQEKYTRELETRSTALSTAIAAISRWYMTMESFNAYLNNQAIPSPDTSDLKELARQARDALAPVQLHCSERAASATMNAIQSLVQMDYLIQEAFQDALNADIEYGAGIDVAPFDAVVSRLRDIYHAELAMLTATSSWEAARNRLNAARVVVDRTRPDVSKLQRAVLERLATEPVVLPEKTRKWLRLPWRKAATPETQPAVDDRQS